MIVRSFRVVAGAAALLAGAATIAAAHDLFLKPEAFFVQPQSTVRLVVLNGTFTTNEGAVTRDRLRELTVVGPAGRTAGDTTGWQASGKTTHWVVPVGDAGTYVFGASLSPKIIALKGSDFNKYLASDGLPDVLAARKAAGELGVSARERYAKHVKALVQVGEGGGNSFSTPLGYPAELIPLDNPYSIHGTNASVRVRALVDGAPVPNQVVLAGGHTASGRTIQEHSVRTDADGVARISIRSPGVWYVKFIRMVKVPPAAGDSVTHESKWATLTFAVR